MWFWILFIGHRVFPQGFGLGGCFLTVCSPALHTGGEWIFSESIIISTRNRLDALSCPRLPSLHQSPTILSSLPFHYVSVFHSPEIPGFIIERIWRLPSCAQTYTHWPAELLFPNQKQTAINRAPSTLSETGESLNQSVKCSYFILSVGPCWK